MKNNEGLKDFLIREIEYLKDKNATRKGQLLVCWYILIGSVIISVFLESSGILLINLIILIALYHQRNKIKCRISDLEIKLLSLSSEDLIDSEDLIF